MIKKIAILAAVSLIGVVAFGTDEAEAQRRGGWGAGGFRGGGWGGPRVVYRSGYGYRGGYWGGGAVAAGLATGVALGAAAAYPYYGYGVAYPAYGYGAYPAYGYYGGGYYYAPRRVVVSRRVVYRGGYGRRYGW